MTNLKFYIYRLCCLVMFLVGGCIAVNQPIDPTASPTNEVVVSSTLIPTNNAPTNTPTSTNTPLPLVETPLPTLSPNDAYLRLQGILQNNANCRLPCWWGFTPGKTSWQDASRFLETFTSVHQEELNRKNPIKDYAYVYVYLPLPPDKGTLDHTYVIKDNKITEISAYVYDWSPFLFLKNILAEQGSPDEVFIRTFRNSDYINGARLYEIILFYGKLGILLEYSGGSLNTVGEKLQNCFDDMKSPFVYIWSPDTPTTSTEAINKYLDIVNLPYPISLEKATGMDVVTFYEAVKKSGNTTCLETPLELWPEQ